MEKRLLAFFITAISMAAGAEQERFTRDNDVITSVFHNMVVARGYDPLLLPSFSHPLDFDLKITKITGQLKVYGINVTGLSSVRRTGPWITDTSDDGFYMSIESAFDQVSVEFYIGGNIKGETILARVRFTISEFDFNLALNQSHEEGMELTACNVKTLTFSEKDVFIVLPINVLTILTKHWAQEVLEEQINKNRLSDLFCRLVKGGLGAANEVLKQ